MLLKNKVSKFLRATLFTGAVALAAPSYAGPVSVWATQLDADNLVLFESSLYGPTYGSVVQHFNWEQLQDQTTVFSAFATVNSFALRWLPDKPASSSLVVKLYHADLPTLPDLANPIRTLTFNDPIPSYSSPYTTINLSSGINAISFSLTNPDPSKYYSFGFTLGLSEFNPTSAVPEAPASAMLLGGLGLVGVTAWRRKRSAIPEASSRQAFA